MSEQIGKKFDAQVDYGWGLSLKMTGKAPAISKRIFDKLSDAQNFTDDYNDSAIEGLILSVVSDGKNNGIYFVERIKKSAEDEPSKLIKVTHDDKKLAVESYDEALELATVDNIGQVVYVKEESYYEDSDNDIIEFKPSPYIIVGEKSLIKLITNIEFENIENEVDNLKSNDERLQNEINYIKEIIDCLGGVDSDYSDKLDELKAKLSILEENIQDTTDNLEESDRQIRVDIEDIKIDIENIKEQINTLVGADSDISDDLDGLKYKIFDLENDYIQLSQQTESKFVETKLKIDTLESQIGDKIKSLESQIEELAGVNSDQYNDLEDVTESIEVINSEISSIREEIKNIEGVDSEKLNELDNKILYLETQLEYLKDLLGDISGIDSDTLGALGDVSEKINELESSIKQTTEELSDSINELESSIKQTTEELSDSINDINSKIEQIQPKLQWLIL